VFVLNIGRKEVRAGFWWGTLRERIHLKNPDVDGKIILRWIFTKWGWGHRLD